MAKRQQEAREGVKGTRNERVESRMQTVRCGNEPPGFSYFSDAAIHDSRTPSTLDTPTPTHHCPPILRRDQNQTPHPDIPDDCEFGTTRTHGR